jgi:trehalose 6-phosphate phosphatase
VSSDLQAVVNGVRAGLAHALIALDFDGTLAPIVPDPTTSRPVPGALASLRALAERGAQVAIVTGRDAATAVSLGGFDRVPGVRVAGLYGAQRWHAGTLDAPPADEPAIVAARVRLPDVLAAAQADPAVWIEDKGLSLVVHGRKAADPEAALAPLREPVAALAAELGLDAHPGRDVLELRLPGYDKGRALRELVDETGARTVLFVGDDVGDLPAIEVVAALRTAGQVAAWSVAVRTAEAPEVASAADASVAGPADVAELLAAIAR